MASNNVINLSGSPSPPSSPLRHNGASARISDPRLALKEDEISRLREERTSLIARNDALIVEKEKLQVDVDLYQKKVKMLENQLESKDELIAAATEGKNRADASLFEMERAHQFDAEMALASAADVEQRTLALEGKISTLIMDKERAERLVNEANENVASLLAEKEQYANDLKEKGAELKEALAALEMRKEGTDKDTADLQMENEQLEKYLGEKDEELKKAIAAIGTQKEAIEAQSAVISSLEADLQDAISALDALKEACKLSASEGNIDDMEDNERGDHMEVNERRDNNMETTDGDQGGEEHAEASSVQEEESNERSTTPGVMRRVANWLSSGSKADAKADSNINESGQKRRRTNA